MHTKAILSRVEDLDIIFTASKSGKKRIDIDGRSISIRRMECFANKGTQCVRCKMVGTVFLVEQWSSGTIHGDIYGMNSAGELVMMTIDHIIPKSKGGLNTLSNYQPMCQPCNTEKGNKL